MIRNELTIITIWLGLLGLWDGAGETESNSIDRQIKRRLDAKIVVERDANGVPHICGDGWLDVLYGLGYLHAIDRGTQILFSRVVARGTAAERIADKPELVETDRLFRCIGLDLQLSTRSR